MEREKIFSKFTTRDYNAELEEILEKKDFPVDVKNLLLSMLYKIEASYKDYTKVKRLVDEQDEYIEEILRIVDKECKKIIVAKPGTKEAEEIEKTNSNYVVDKLEGSIWLMYPNEKLLLYTLYKLNDRQIYLDEKYNLIRVALSDLLNDGENINNTEVLRDFNGWNWNAVDSEIPDIITNLVYQNLIYLLGIDFIKQWVHKEEFMDYMKLFQEKMIKLYGEENTKQILNELYKISIIICTSQNEIEKKRLLEEKADLQAEFDKLNNKKALLNEISELTKDSIKKIKQIDKILNDRNLLYNEFIKRNQKRPEYNKILNIVHMEEILNKERKKILANIESSNKLSEPNFYLQVKKNLEDQLELLKDIEIKKQEQEQRKLQYAINLQKAFIKCFSIKIEKAMQKDDIIKLFYMLRYYNLLFIKNNERIYEQEELKNELNKLQQDLINKAFEIKAINIITTESNINNKIIKNILTSKIISIENINIELTESGTGLDIQIYDGDIYEKTIKITDYNKKMMLAKFGKKLKVF